MFRSVVGSPVIRGICRMVTQPMQTWCVRVRNLSTDYLQHSKSPEAAVNSQLHVNDDLTDDTILIPNSDSFYPNKPVLIAKVRQVLSCSETKAKEVVEGDRNLSKVSLNQLTETVRFLSQRRVTDKMLFEYPWLLSMSPKLLRLKMELLMSMDPIKNNDFVPLLRATAPRLHKIAQITKKEADIIPGRHRVYYCSNKLELDPKIVSKYFSTHLFMFDIPLENLAESMDIFLEYNVAPINIVRDLWAFKYTPSSIRNRLERVKVAHREKIMPWMVRCPETVLAKTLQLSLEKRALLGNTDTVLQYIAKRIGYDTQTTRVILMKHPAVLKVRVTKIKEILDFLLNEAGFSAHDIAQVPRIMCHGLKTTKKRLIELKNFGCRPTTLVVVCKSRREYQKFINQWLFTRNKSHDAS